MSNFQKDFGLEVKWRGPIKEALAAHFQCDPEDFFHNVHLDLFGAGDLICAGTSPRLRIALRVRRSISAAKYTHQFTLRLDRPSGRKTEIEKLKEVIATGERVVGFYGIEDATGTGFVVSNLIDLNSLVISGEIDRPCDVRENWDGSSNFNAYLLTKVPHSVIVVKSLGGEQ